MSTPWCKHNNLPPCPECGDDKARLRSLVRELTEALEWSRDKADQIARMNAPVVARSTADGILIRCNRALARAREVVGHG